ncbi:zinc finger CCHC domain-containing protein 7-like [Paramacrobiotus metropolitanus]|uniref:zinc finger CCHC domain-containing protein 7-like n=1 Tax=Paramacrobiotus metropolitanus TaxID=2943436 RepID=UPI002445FE32|nr:zinc finger CCHC domain-containing protein 7-like [Paramacrobiotus metropolitanus]
MHVDTDSGDETDTETEELSSQEPSIPNRPAQKNGTVGFKLPRLTSSLEKDVLGGIFSQWEQEAAGHVKEKDAVKNPSDGLQVHMNGIPPVKPGIPVDNKAGDAAPRPKNSVPVAPASAQPAGILRNSSSSAFLCLDTIMASLPDNAGAWSISSYDKMREKGVYLQTRDSRERPKICCRCGERTSSKHHRCPQIVCGVCHSYDHWQHACPFQTTVSTLTCKRCQSVGHLDIVCTDTWRQYHTTITPNCGFIMSTTKKKTLHCCNCAVPGHLYHECRRKRYNKYAVSSPNVFVKRYDAGENSKKRHPPRDVESPMEKFSRMVCDMMSEEDSELMSATYDHKKSSRKRMRGGSSLLSSPNKRKRKGHR